MSGSCFGCKYCSAGRWVGWSCKKGAPGDDDDYSCWEEDEDKKFWTNYIDEDVIDYIGAIKAMETEYE